MSGATAPTAIYSFGDSLSDAGDASLFTSSRLASALGLSALPVSPPYFQETYAASGGGTISASVFSNGPVWVQDLAVSLGLEAPAPGQMGASANTLTAVLIAEGQSSFAAALAVGALEAQQHTTGSNPYLVLAAGAAAGTDFAIGGSVTGQTAFNADPGIALTDLQAQITNFQAAVPAPAEGALYTIWSGANDVLNLAQSADIAALVASGAAAADIAQSAQAEADAVQRLIDGGARDLLVLDVPDLGLAPSLRQGGDAASALGTQLSQLFNADLAADLARLAVGAASVKLADVYGLIDGAVADPASHGLGNVTDPVYSGGYDAFTPGDLVSADPDVQDGYLFFDGLHPTATGQKAVATLAAQTLAGDVTACFAAGTRIRTATGDVPVERLRVGERVVSAFGGVAEVIWTGHRRVACARHPRPHDVWPVRVEAGAFGPGRPERTLWLSPDHAVHVGDALIPVRYLLNGATIAQPPCERVTYWHVELPQHDVLFADGLACESYLDTGNRAAFGTGVAQLHPAFAREAWAAQGCAELVVSGARLAAARAAVLRRAGALGHAATDDPALALRVDSRALAGAADGRATLPRGARALTLVSRRFVPAHMRPDSADTRALGVAIAGLSLDGEPVALDDPRLRGGWHAPEPGFRWTDGAGVVAVDGAREVAFQVAMAGPYWRGEAARSACSGAAAAAG